MKINVLGIDLAKNVFQLCALNQANKCLFNRSVRRAKLLAFVAQRALKAIAMEACASAHYWGRTFEAHGLKVVLIPAQHVTPFVRGGKSNARDALAICEAANRLGLHPVPIKTMAQQDIQLLHRLRQAEVCHSTALANQLRSLAREYGVLMPASIHRLMNQCCEVLEDGNNDLSPIARRALADLYNRLKTSRSRVKQLAGEIDELTALQPAYRALQALPGVGRSSPLPIWLQWAMGMPFSGGDRCRSGRDWCLGNRLPAASCY